MLGAMAQALGAMSENSAASSQARECTVTTPLGRQAFQVMLNVKIIAGPARESEQRIQMRRYRDQVGTELQMRAQLVTLYGNALAAVNRNGLNAPVGNDPSPFVEHWTGKTEEAAGNVKLFAGS